jgi:hypothetical protein
MFYLSVCTIFAPFVWKGYQAFNIPTRQGWKMKVLFYLGFVFNHYHCIDYESENDKEQIKYEILRMDNLFEQFPQFIMQSLNIIYIGNT